jgi:hypothetical protein
MLRLRQIAFVAFDLDAAVSSITTALDIAVAFRDPGVATFGLHNAVMPVGNQFIEVVAPIRDSTAAGRYLERRNGDGGYMVILQCDEHERRRLRIAGMGIRFALAHDTAEYRLLQLHPADTGGSFLEIDEQIGGEDMATGPWEPAGPDWQAARRTTLVSGIVAADIQAADPSALAARWSDILDVATRPDRDDPSTPTIPLDNAVLRFVEAIDGRGDGLCTIDVAPGEHEHGPDTLALCGVTVRRGR